MNNAAILGNRCRRFDDTSSARSRRFGVETMTVRNELQEATTVDYPAVIEMTNRAYRDISGQAEWKVETLIRGTRIDESLLRDDLAASGARLLIWRDTAGAHIGHVRLEDSGDGSWYLAMLTVKPDIQDSGFGRQLLAAAENFAKKHGARRMRLSVVHQRAELIAWYERRGYARTGETEPFPYGDDRFGRPIREDLFFEILEKVL
jgi:ribosomal protein S18 acetylase RimI-like enzyme